MAELGATRQYTYWSNRSVQGVVDDNGIRLEPGWRFGVRSPSAGLIPQVEATQAPRRLSRHEVAQKIERAIGQLAVEDFVTPPPCSFAKGASRVTFAVYERRSHVERDKPGNKALIMHTRVLSSDGTQVEVCLFGSLDNCIGLATEPAAGEWRASSRWTIEDFIKIRDLPTEVDQQVAWSIVRTLHEEGLVDRYVFTAPDSSEWFAQIYKDISLENSRWSDLGRGGVPGPIGRIVIGAPLWVRTTGPP
jgi:hypothetical protein